MNFEDKSSSIIIDNIFHDKNLKIRVGNNELMVNGFGSGGWGSTSTAIWTLEEAIKLRDFLNEHIVTEEYTDMVPVIKTRTVIK